MRLHALEALKKILRSPLELFMGVITEDPSGKMECCDISQFGIKPDFIVLRSRAITGRLYYGK